VVGKGFALYADNRTLLYPFALYPTTFTSRPKLLQRQLPMMAVTGQFPFTRIHASVLSFKMSNATGASHVSLGDTLVMAQAEAKIDGGMLLGATCCGEDVWLHYTHLLPCKV
jgi:hypothetical protein